MNALSPRIAWDRDGSIMTYIGIDGVVLNSTTAVRREVNSENGTGAPCSPSGAASSSRIAVVFPVPMDLTTIFIATDDAYMPYPHIIETSKDTTNGIDGAWETQNIIDWVPNQPVKPNYRQAVSCRTLLPGTPSIGVRGIRMSTNSPSGFRGILRALHLYGAPSATATKDRLALWHPTTDTVLPPTWLDWGDVPRGTSSDRSFRIKNLSVTLTAQNIGLYIEALTAGVPSVAGMHTMSDTAGATFQSTLTIATLAPGALSAVFILRRVVPSNAQVSVWSARIVADVTQWIGV